MKNNYEKYLKELLRQLNIALNGALYNTTVNVVCNHYFGNTPILIHFKITQPSQSNAFTLHIYQNEETNTDRVFLVFNKPSILKSISRDTLENILKRVNIHNYKSDLPSHISMVLTDCKEDFFTHSHFLMHI